jgi:hypothetical protein
MGVEACRQQRHAKNLLWFLDDGKLCGATFKVYTFKGANREKRVKSKS